MQGQAVRGGSDKGREGQVHNAVNALQTMTAELAVAIDRPETRLAPVTVQTPTTPPRDEKSVRAVTCELAESIDVQAGTVGFHAQRIRDLIDRLQV